VRFKVILENKLDLEVTAVNDLTDGKTLTHLLNMTLLTAGLKAKQN